MISNRVISYYKIAFIVFLIIFSSVSSVFAANYDSIDNNYRTYIIKDFYFAVEFDNENNTMELILPDGSSKILERNISASGARYGFNNITFWNKGERAQLFIDDRSIFEAERAEITGVNSNLLKKFSDEAKLEEAVFFRIKDSYIMYKEQADKVELILNGNKFTISEQSKTGQINNYIKDNIKIIELNDGLLIHVNDFELFAEEVNMDDYLEKNDLIIKGLGQEPGWMMKISNETIELELDYGQVNLSINPSYFNLKVAKEKIEYDVMTSLVDFKIEIIKDTHSDIMSGKIFPYTVKITGGKIDLLGGAYISN